MGAPWSDEDKTALRQMAMDGMSASEIGATFSPPRSRNAVIGVCHRAKPKIELKGLSPVAPRPPRKRVERVIRIKKESKRQPPPKPIHHPVAEPDFELAPPLRADAFAPLPGSAPIRVADHKDGCRWPIGDGPFLFCNEAVSSGHYCATHAQVAHRPTPPIKFNGKKTAK